jgi:hypothetical protein
MMNQLTPEKPPRRRVWPFIVGAVILAACLFVSGVLIAWIQEGMSINIDLPGGEETRLVETALPTNTTTSTLRPQMTQTTQSTITPADMGVVTSNVEGYDVPVIPYPQISGNVLYVWASAPAGGNGTQARPFQRIQQAIDAAGSGDTILVAQGTYYENLVIENAVLSIIGGYDGATWEQWRSPSEIVVDGGEVTQVVLIRNAQVLLSIMTIQNGYEACENDPVNGYPSSGAGLKIQGEVTQVIMDRLVIQNNITAPPCGGSGFQADTGASFLMFDSLMQDNVNSADGGGIIVWNEALGVIVNSTIIRNGLQGVEVNNSQGGSGWLINTIVMNNQGDDVVGDWTIINSMYGGYAQDFETDWHLWPGAPAVDAGVWIEGLTPPFDLDGEPRPAGQEMDIGADELQ